MSRMNDQVDKDNVEDVYSSSKPSDTEEKKDWKKTKKRIIRYTKLFITLIVLGCLVFIIASKREAIAKFLWPEITPIVDDMDDDEPSINIEYISKKIEKISSLQTAKITYGCMVDFEEGTLKFINKKGFSMFYEATAYAGIDVSKIEVAEKNGKFIVQLPESKIEEAPNIDPLSIVFYNKESGIINDLEPEDVTEAQQYARKDVYYQATTDQLLDLADNNAISVLKNLLLCFLDENQFEIHPGIRTQDVKIKPPISSVEALKKYDGNGKDKSYKELIQVFEEAGFKNIKTVPIQDIKIGVFTKEGAVESVSIDGKTAFKRSNIFSSNAEIVIKYHAKKAK